MKTLPRTKVDSIKGLSETPCKMESEQQAFVMTAEASEAKQRKACQPFWRTVNFDALFQIKANFSFTQNNNKLGDNIKKKSNGILY